MKNNLNPLYEYGLFDYEGNGIGGLPDPATVSGSDIGFKDPELEKYWDKLGKASKSTTRGKFIGGWTGLALGSIGGNVLSGELGGNKERKLIKDIIIKSDSKEDCINKLKQLRTPKAFKYAKIVEKTRDNFGWKNDLATSINIKNSLVKGAGTIGGGLVGNVIGRNIGGRIGYSKYPKQYKKYFPYEYDFNDPLDFDNLTHY